MHFRIPRVVKKVKQLQDESRTYLLAESDDYLAYLAAIPAIEFNRKLDPVRE